MEFHPIANIFPMMSDEELSELSKDITSNGLRVPILLHEGKILDGRSRYQACESSGVKPEYTEFEGDDPLSHVLDLHLHRPKVRHLTTGQKAVVVAEWEYAARGGLVGKRHHGGDDSRNIFDPAWLDSAALQLAKALKVPLIYVSEALVIQRESPNRYQQVKSGEMSIPRAKFETRVFDGFIKHDELENQNDLASRQDQDTKKGDMGWYLQVFKKYAVFKGRARRKEYWVFMLINTTVIAILMIIEAVTGIKDIYSISDLYGLVVAIPVSAVATRRLHDTGRSGWWQFLILVLVIGWIPLLIWLLKESDDGDNKYGPNPKEIPTLADTNTDINA